MIEGWQQKLQGNDIAEGLGQLKQAIMNGDTPAIAKILTDLGEDIREAVASATDANAAAKARQHGSNCPESRENGNRSRRYGVWHRRPFTSSNLGPLRNRVPFRGCDLGYRVATGGSCSGSIVSATVRSC